MEDFSLKTLIATGMLVGAAVWVFDRRHSDGDRSPSAIGQEIKVKAKKAPYHPSLNEFSTQRDAEVNVRVDDKTANTNAAPAVNPDANANANPDLNVPVAVATGGSESSEFATTKLEITKNLAQGDVDSALDLAERRLEEGVKAPNTEMAYIGYLHDFIMQNSQDPEAEMNVTINALKDAESPNVKKFLYQEFKKYSPDKVEDLDHELDISGISVN